MKGDVVAQAPKTVALELTGQSVVYRQPQTPDEIALAVEALGQCPTESIGDGGM